RRAHRVRWRRWRRFDDRLILRDWIGRRIQGDVGVERVARNVVEVRGRVAYHDGPTSTEVRTRTRPFLRDRSSQEALELRVGVDRQRAAVRLGPADLRGYPDGAQWRLVEMHADTVVGHVGCEKVIVAIFSDKEIGRSQHPRDAVDVP